MLSSYTDATGSRLLLDEIRSALQTPMERRWSALWSPAVRGSLLIGVGFTVLQQVTGINTIIYYGPRIFSLAGITSNESAIFATLLVAVTNVLATIIALVLVDRVGRKPLLYVGVSGMTVSLSMLAYSFHNPAALGASPGVIATVDNADNASHESFQAGERHAFQGRCVAFVKATAPSGQIALTASASGLTAGSISIQTTQLPLTK